VTSFFSISPRYLVELMPLLYLLAWSLLEDVRFARRHVALGAATGTALAAALWIAGAGDRSPSKIAFLTNVPVTIAGLLAVAHLLSRQRTASRAFVTLVPLAYAVAFACLLSEDGRALVGFGSVQERWGRSFLSVAPPKVAVVGWGFAKDPIFHVRARRDMVSVDASLDDAASLPQTLDALVAAGRTAFYFGWGIERCAESLAGRYRSVQVLSDPVVFRLEPLANPAHRP
jgi:hypothetical protein